MKNPGEGTSSSSGKSDKPLENTVQARVVSAVSRPVRPPTSVRSALGLIYPETKFGQAVIRLTEHPGEWIVIPGVRRILVNRIKRVFRWRIEQKPVDARIDGKSVTTTAYRFWPPPYDDR
jgi:hypothetical protein